MKPSVALVGVASRMPEDSTKTVTSRDLLAGRRVLVIQHEREEYRLQVTRSGKLILTK